MKVGFIGLGDQGAPIAHRMIDHGIELTVWGRRAASVEPFAAAGAKVAASPAELAAGVELVGVCVRADDDVREVVVGADGLLAGARRGLVIAIHSTITPQTVIDLEALARKKGVHLLDAPVSGGAAGARAGTMTVMAGGSAEALEIARPALESFATNIPHLGGVGAGQQLKLLNNNLCYANIAMAVSALEIAAKLGVDPDRAAEIMMTSSGSSAGLGILLNRPLLAHATSAASAIPKDIHIFQKLMADQGLGERLAPRVTRTTVEAMKRYAESLSPPA